MSSFLQSGLACVAVAASAGALAGTPDARIRVNQAGYLVHGTKEARLLATVPEDGATFTVTDAAGKVVLTAPVRRKAGAWNQTYAQVYLLDFSGVTNPGVYSLRVEGPAAASSPTFPVGTRSELYAPLLRNALSFFQAQRDGPEVVPGLLNRKPAHLADQEAWVYKTPNFGKRGLQGRLEKIGGCVDVSGGWADAGDYVKFVATSSYVTALMLHGVREHPAQMGQGGLADFVAEARFGLDWLLKMWNGQTRTLYVQVGLGDGNAQVIGDHDLWRLPEADDQVEAVPGTPRYFIKHRPVFQAGPAGSAISPNLAGRLAAAFALGNQVFRAEDPAYAQRLLAAAQQVFELAATNNVRGLTTVFPHEFYPEDEWRDDLEWGAVELYFAAAKAEPAATPSHANGARYLQLAAHWAREYLASGQQDTLNLYDVSGLAHYELCRALVQGGAPDGLEVSRTELLASLRRRLETAASRGEKDPFGLGLRYTAGDLVPHVLGLVLEADLYDQLTQTKTFVDFSRQQLDFVLGGNAWGASFIVGAGKTFPFHLQHQVANLAGALDGTAPVLLGATVDGPARGAARGGETPDGARATPWPGGQDPFAPFNGSQVQYVDDVGSWATVEPAIDYTIPSALVFAWRVARDSKQ
jgi:hypothetical protein